MNTQELNLLGAKITEKELEFSDLMKSFPKGTRMSPTEKRYADSLATDIKNLTTQLDSEQRSSNETRIKNGIVATTDILEGQRRVKTTIFPQTREGQKDSYIAGCAYMSLLAEDADVRAEYEKKFESAKGISLAEMKQRSTLGEGVNSGGGVLVETLMGDEFIVNQLAYSVVRQNAQVVPVITDKVYWPRKVLSPNVVNLSEGGTLSQSTYQLQPIQVNVQTAGTLLSVPNQLLNDSHVVSLGSFITDQVIQQFGFAEDFSTWNGVGDSKNFGIVGVIQSFSAVDTTGLIACYSNSGSSASLSNVTMKDIAKLVSNYPSLTVGANPKFYCTQAVYGQVMLNLSMNNVGVGSGNTMLTYQEGIGDIAGGLKRKFMGYDVEIINAAPAFTSNVANQQFLWFGDLDKVCLFADRSGLMVDSTGIGGNAFSSYSTLFRGISRWGSTIHDLSIYAGDNTTQVAGPFLALATA